MKLPCFPNIKFATNTVSTAPLNGHRSYEDPARFKGATQQLRYTGLERRMEVYCQRIDQTVIKIGDTALDELGRYFDVPEGATRDVVIVADRDVWKIHGAALTNELSSMGVAYRDILVRGGERAKSLSTLHRIWRELAKLSTRRRTPLIAFGGGVVCDMAGFAASTYMRGLPYVLVPTSLVAQVDAAIGGKVAVDTLGAKNAIGAFYHPEIVIVCPRFLKTLPDREISGGMAEIIKVAVLASEEDFVDIESMGKISSSRIHLITEERLARWIRRKLDFLASDPFERGSLDRELNFGHSFGHAIESANKYETYRHGEAVSIGIALACRIALGRGILSQTIMNRIISCLRRCQLPTNIPVEILDKVWQCVSRIRAIRDGQLREVLPTRLGECIIVKDVSYAEYVRACTLEP